MPSQLHIIHGVLALDVGGLERIVLSLIHAACQQGHKVSVVCVERPGKLADIAKAEGAAIISLDKPPGRLPEFIGKATSALAGLKPDIIHTHQIGAAWYMGQAARSLGCPPVLHTEHGNEFARSSTWFKRVKTRLFFRQTARFIDSFCCVSGEIAEAVTRWGTVPRAKVEVVPNGIRIDGRPDMVASVDDIRASLGIPEGAPVVGTVGRMAEVKRQDLLIRAVAKLRATIPDIRLLLVGDGEERTRLEALAREVGLTSQTYFVGYQPNPEQYFRIMSVFALTSRSEGFPVSLLEAWLANLPVVCTAVGGIPNIVSHEANGLLFPPNDEAAIASSLLRVLQDDALRVLIANAGGRTVREHFSLDRMATEYESRYRSLLGTHQGQQ